MIFGFFEPDVPEVTVEDVFASMQKKEKVVLLDVRTRGEYEKRRIAHSVNLPVDELEEKIINCVPNKSEKVYVYCMSGARSKVAADMMIKMGYTNAFSVKSGLLAWNVKKYSIEQ